MKNKKLIVPSFLNHVHIILGSCIYSVDCRFIIIYSYHYAYRSLLSLRFFTFIDTLFIDICRGCIWYRYVF